MSIFLKKRTMEDLIKKKCAEAGVDPDVLTPKEIEELKKEIKADLRGEFYLDSVLFNPEVFSRKSKKKSV